MIHDGHCEAGTCAENDQEKRSGLGALRPKTPLVGIGKGGGDEWQGKI